MAIQLVTGIMALAVLLGFSRIFSTLVHILASVSSLLEAQKRLLDVTETARYIMASRSENRGSISYEEGMMDTQAEINIWDDTTPVDERASSLNGLIKLLTNDENISKCI
jgi:hypothetical protein